MSDRTFDRETLLDLSVNVIPLGILLFFVVAFAVIAPFPANPVVVVIQMSIIIITGIALAILTYYSGKAIAGTERDHENAIPPGYSPEDANHVSGDEADVN